MSRLNNKDSSTYGNVNTHIFTEFGTLAKETTQKEMLAAIKDINIDVGEIVVGDITVESNDTITHTKLDTLNATVINKHLNSATDSITAVVPNLNFATDSVNVVEQVKSIPYDLNILAAQMYADSINSAIVDPYGREGWFWTNGATTGGSNCYFYSNSLVPQNDMSKAGIECVYTVMALDRVQPNIVLPFVSMYSKPTGASDFIPGFAHSQWVYTIPATHYLNAGEVVMLTIGDHTKVENIQPELRRIHLVLTTTNGQAGDAEVIDHISLNTDSGLKELNGIQYLLKNAGFYYNQTDKTTDYVFLNSIERMLRLNLSGKNASSSLDNIRVNINTTNGNQISANSNNELKVEVTNFPTSFEVSNTVGVTGDFYQATQPISGTVDVATLPSITIANTSFEVSNTVGVTGDFYQATQPISGTVDVATLPSITIANTSFEVSNTVPVTGSFYQATQPISGSVSVSNFPSSQVVTGTFFQATQPISGSVNVSNSSLAVTGSFYQATQPISGSVSVSNLPSTQNVSVTSGSIDINNFPVNQTVSGTVNIGNYPTTQNVSVTSGSISVSNLPATQPVSGSVSVSNFPSSQAVTGTFYQATQPISGSVSVSNFPATQPISGSISNSFTLDTTTQSTNTKLDTIHTDLDGLTFDGSSNLNVNIAAGSISVSSVNIKDSSGNNLNSTSNALNSYITNSSLDNHMYVSTNGSTWHHASADSNGQLNVHSKTQDGAGTDITSSLIGSKQSLDVNIANTSAVPVSGTFYQATQPISGSVSVSNFPTSTNSHTQAYDPSGGGGYFDITSTNISASVSALDVAVKNTVPVSGTFYQATQPVSISGSVPVTGTFYQATQPVSVATSLNVNINDFAGNSLTSDTFTFNGATKNGLDVAIINNSSNPVPVSGTFYPATQPVSGTVGISGTVPVSGTVGISGTVPVSGTFYQATQPVSGTIAITDSLGGNIIANANSLQTVITNTSIPVTGYVDAYLKDGSGNSINSTSSAINSFLTNTKTTNDYSASGLNVYQIYPKIKSFALSGFSNHNVADVMLAGQSNTLTVNSYAWGKINANKSYWLYTPTGANVRTISYNYINSSGAEATGTATGVVNSYVALQSNIICLNNFTITGGVSPISTDALYITLAGSGTTTTSVASIVGTRLNTNNAIFTVPNNAIAMVTNIDGALSTTNDYYYMNVWDADGNRTVPSASYMYITGVNNYKAASGDNGCIGRILTAGETVAFTTSVTTSTNRNVYANIKVIYL